MGASVTMAAVSALAVAAVSAAVAGLMPFSASAPEPPAAATPQQVESRALDLEAKPVAGAWPWLLWEPRVEAAP